MENLPVAVYHTQRGLQKYCTRTEMDVVYPISLVPMNRRGLPDP